MQRKPTSIILAFLLMIIGALITLENYSIISEISFHWPILLLIFGLGFILLFFNRRMEDPVLIWLGSFSSFLSFFFYYLNLTSWLSLSSLWPIFLGIVGISFLMITLFTKRILFAYFAGSFLALFIIFTLVFSISSKLWPLSFVVFGLSLLIIEYLNRKMVT